MNIFPCLQIFLYKYHPLSNKGRLISNTKQKSIYNTRVEIQNQSSYLKYFKSCNIQYADEKGLF